MQGRKKEKEMKESEGRFDERSSKEGNSDHFRDKREKNIYIYICNTFSFVSFLIDVFICYENFV